MQPKPPWRPTSPTVKLAPSTATNPFRQNIFEPRRFYLQIQTTIIVAVNPFAPRLRWFECGLKLSVHQALDRVLTNAQSLLRYQPVSRLNWSVLKVSSMTSKRTQDSVAETFWSKPVTVKQQPLMAILAPVFRQPASIQEQRQFGADEIAPDRESR